MHHFLKKTLETLKLRVLIKYSNLYLTLFDKFNLFSKYQGSENELWYRGLKTDTRISGF